MGSFIMLGIALLATVALVQLIVTNWWWRAGISITVVLLLTWALAVLSGPVWLGDAEDDRWYDVSPYSEGILFALMVVGMTARLLSLAIEERRLKISSVAPTDPVPSLTIDRWEFVYPMLFAIPTFGAILSQIETPGLSVAAVVLAFQTGFFWQTVLEAQSSTRKQQ